MPHWTPSWSPPVRRRSPPGHLPWTPAAPPSSSSRRSYSASSPSPAAASRPLKPRYSLHLFIRFASIGCGFARVSVVTSLSSYVCRMDSISGPPIRLMNKSWIRWQWLLGIPPCLSWKLFFDGEKGRGNTKILWFFLQFSSLMSVLFDDFQWISKRRKWCVDISKEGPHCWFTSIFSFIFRNLLGNLIKHIYIKIIKNCLLCVYYAWFKWHMLILHGLNFIHLYWIL